MIDLNKFKTGDLLSIQVQGRPISLEVNIPFTSMEDLITWENMVSAEGVVSLSPKYKFLRIKRKDNKATFLARKDNWAVLLCMETFICINLSSDWIYFKLISSKNS